MKLIKVEKLLPIEGYGPKKAEKLGKKILKDGQWTRPVCVFKLQTKTIIMDGHHRVEAAKILGLKRIPCEFYTYDEVELKSMRKQYNVTDIEIIQRALSGDLYPYKTVRRVFPGGYPECEVNLEELK